MFFLRFKNFTNLLCGTAICKIIKIYQLPLQTLVSVEKSGNGNFKDAVLHCEDCWASAW